MIFEVCKNQPKMTKVQHLGGKNEKGAPILGGSASRAVVLGRVFRAVLQVLGEVLQELFDTPGTPLCETGSADLKGSALPADPIIQKIQKYKQNVF